MLSVTLIIQEVTKSRAKRYKIPFNATSVVFHCKFMQQDEMILILTSTAMANGAMYAMGLAMWST